MPPGLPPCGPGARRPRARSPHIYVYGLGARGRAARPARPSARARDGRGRRAGRTRGSRRTGCRPGPGRAPRPRTTSHCPAPRPPRCGRCRTPWPAPPQHWLRPSKGRAYPACPLSVGAKCLRHGGLCKRGRFYSSQAAMSSSVGVSDPRMPAGMSATSGPGSKSSCGHRGCAGMRHRPVMGDAARSDNAADEYRAERRCDLDRGGPDARAIGCARAFGGCGVGSGAHRAERRRRRRTEQVATARRLRGVLPRDQPLRDPARAARLARARLRPPNARVLRPAYEGTQEQVSLPCCASTFVFGTARIAAAVWAPNRSNQHTA